MRTVPPPPAIVPSASSAVKARRPKCENCGTPYERAKHNQRFCNANCKAEFHRHGSAFGPLKETVSNIARTEARAVIADNERHFEKLLELCDRQTEQLSALATRVEHFAKSVSQVARLSREVDELRNELEVLKLENATRRTSEAFARMKESRPLIDPETGMIDADVALKSLPAHLREELTRGPEAAKTIRTTSREITKPKSAHNKSRSQKANQGSVSKLTR